MGPVEVNGVEGTRELIGKEIGSSDWRTDT
jgi:hypothetical protein